MSYLLVMSLSIMTTNMLLYSRHLRDRSVEIIELINKNLTMMGDTIYISLSLR